MKKEEVYKKIVLGILFVFPLLVYLFFASGKNNFAKLLFFLRNNGTS